MPIDPNAADAEKVRNELDELLNSGRVIGYSVGEAGDGKKKISVDFEMHRAAPAPGPEQAGAPTPMPAAASRSVQRITKEAMAELSEVYPEEFLQAMGLDL
jgi:hypothetical protein